jgi:hypothetical protein
MIILISEPDGIGMNGWIYLNKLIDLPLIRVIDMILGIIYVLHIHLRLLNQWRWCHRYEPYQYPCWQGDTRVLCADGTRIAIDQLREGDMLASPTIPGTDDVNIAAAKC